MRVMSGYTHIDVCKLALIDENMFNNFKNQPAYNAILEHCNFYQGIDYLEKIKKSEIWDKLNWDLYLQNDSIGNPLTYSYNINKIDRNISPSTLRYVSTGIDILNHIKNLKLNNLNICEIGGGYGGQHKILMDLALLFDIKIFKYKIIDIPEASQLQKKYLNKLGYNNVLCVDCFNFDVENYDLLISNYGFSEFDYDIREEYIESVVKHCNHYFIIWNNKQIDKYFSDAIIVPEVPLTGRFNKILIK